MISYQLPRDVFPKQDHKYIFDEEICQAELVNPVNHGEFQNAKSRIVEAAAKSDKGRVHRCAIFAFQRCRRGGKTFMLHAVAKLLEEEARKEGTELDKETHVILISLNSDTKFRSEEDPYTAILSRIAYAWEIILGEESDFRHFRKRCRDFGVVDEWLSKPSNKKVILLIDELSVIQPGGTRYEGMSHMLDDLAGREGCAVAYSTHYRSYADILRGQEGTNFRLSTRNHYFLPIPRVSNKLCLEGLKPSSSQDCSLWSAVLRGRIPCLILSDQEQITAFADFSFEREAMQKAGRNYFDQEFLQTEALTRRIAGLASAITGEIAEWDDHTREEFKAYSYVAEQLGNNRKPLCAWPPFLLGSKAVLGRHYKDLFGTLCHPQIDEAKAFEALSELAVLLRLLSSQRHQFVRAVQGLSLSEAYHATEMYHVDEEARDLESLINKVQVKYAYEDHVKQVVVVPYFASFPIYDFFIFHRSETKDWVAAAGYQCKLGDELPDKEHCAWEDIKLSVWIGGSCRKYRVNEWGARAPCVVKNGWKAMGQDTQFDMLGVSISEALPHHVASVNAPACEFCEAEQHMKERKEAACAGPKRLKIG